MVISTGSNGTAPIGPKPFDLALCNEVVRDLPFAAQCELAASLGFDALEVAPFTLADDPRKLSDGDLERLRADAEGAGIRVSSLHWLLTAPTGLSITSADAAIRTATLEVMEALVGMCAALGGSVLVHGSPAQRELSSSDPEGDSERGKQAFADIAEVAERAGVVYCIEPLSPQETTFINTVGEAEAVVAAVGSPALRTMLDTRAARLSETEPIEQVLTRGLAAGTVAHVHVNDVSKLGPGQGADEFAGLFEVLLDHGYHGVVAVEPFDYQPSGETAAARAAGYVQGVIEGLAFKRAGRTVADRDGPNGRRAREPRRK